MKIPEDQMNRRDFINLISMEAAALYLSSATAFAQNKMISTSGWGADNWDGFFVTIIMPGAWDISLSLDPWVEAKRPKESDYFLEYSANQLLPWGTSFLGPAMEPMKSHFKDISVINGIFMSTNDNGHEALRSYSITGDASNLRGALALEINEKLPRNLFSVIKDAPIPLGERSDRSTDIFTGDKLLTEQSKTMAQIFIQKAQSGILSKVRSASAEMAKVETGKKLLAQYSTKVTDVQAAKKALVCAASFVAGLSRTAVINVTENIDIHSNHLGVHLANQTKNWQSISNLFSLFKSVEIPGTGKSLFDKTTFFVTSEFNRTPALNNAKGKDHNPWSNSALVAGRGIKGGLVQGKSSLVTLEDSSFGIPYLTGLSYDFENSAPILNKGLLNQKTSPVLPSHVLRTLVDAMQLNLNVIGGGLHNSKPFKNLLNL
jgi:hypothetical protein